MNCELDKALKAVMEKRESQRETPALPSDFDQRVMSRINDATITTEKAPKKTVALWHWTAIAAAIALLCYLSISLFHEDDVKPSPSKVAAQKTAVKKSSFDITKSEVMPATIDTPLQEIKENVPQIKTNELDKADKMPVEPGFEWASSLLADYDVKKEGKLKTVDASKLRYRPSQQKPSIAEQRTPEEIERELYQSLEQIANQGKELANIINEIKEDDKKHFQLTINNYQQ